MEQTKSYEICPNWQLLSFKSTSCIFELKLGINILDLILIMMEFVFGLGRR